MEKRLICICGPTASGKTALSVALAQQLHTEIISADSMQLYREMDIGTAKPDMKERQGVPHHLFDVCEPGEAFSVARYVELADAAAQDILSRGMTPIVVGGTGLYMDALIECSVFSGDETDLTVREKYQRMAAEQGNQAVHDCLAKVDPAGAERLHPNNLKRVIRALEVYEQTGMTIDEFNRRNKRPEPKYDALKIGVCPSDREILYDRINRRVDLMVENGLVEESYAVWKTNPKQTAANAIGYKELIPYFTGESDLSACIDKLKQETRRYAKRQLTWFRKRADVVWIKLYKFNNNKEILEKSKKIIAKQQFLCYNRIGLFETTEK